ncbi:MAG: hypothetical protein WBC06_15075 [Chitinophagaceae bacterium]
MRKLFFLLSLVISFHTYSQNYFDTTFSVRGYVCSCKYTTNIEEDNKLFDRSEVSAYYPGGEKEWEKYLKKNLNNDFKGKKNEFSVQFVISKDGYLSDFRLLDRAVNQKYEEAIRVLKLSGKWFPAIQNGYCVKSYYRITFKF